MKIAEALISKTEMETKISRLQSRITNNLIVQEGETAQEDANRLIRELEEVSVELTKLIGKIQAANAKYNVVNENGEEEDFTIQEALINRDGLVKLQDQLRYFASEAVPNTRYSNTEIKMIPVVNSEVLQKKADKLAQEARILDINIQRTNWIKDI